jgi:hypothetical protein
MPMLACYTDQTSVRPDERVALHASASRGPCRLDICRIGAGAELVLTREGIQISAYPTPPGADRHGCAWPVALAVEIGRWRSGYYDIRLTDAAGEETHHFVCIKPPKGRPSMRAVLVLATNTYHAYNWWGGANAYCNVAGLMSGEVRFPQAMDQAIGVLSTQRAFAPLIVAPPDDMPRLVNMRTRAIGAAVGKRSRMDGHPQGLPLRRFGRRRRTAEGDADARPAGKSRDRRHRPVRLRREAGRGYKRMIPRRTRCVARIVCGDDGPEARASVLRGHAVLASFKRGRGEVFNTGTTEWAHGAAARDPVVEAITTNVMRRFGLSRAAG